jgi:hypothetical protein
LIRWAALLPTRLTWCTRLAPATITRLGGFRVAVVAADGIFVGTVRDGPSSSAAAAVNSSHSGSMDFPRDSQRTNDLRRAEVGRIRVGVARIT